MKRDGFAEEGRLVIGLGSEALIEDLSRVSGGAKMQLADTEPETSFDALGIDLEGLLKRLGGVLPALDALEADTAIVESGLVFGSAWATFW
jgi:hypothetical protein